MPTQTISRCGGGASGFVTLLVASNPDAIWPLNEVSGTTAHDALSGHHDAFASASPPTFAADTSPLGTPAPSFARDQNFTTTWAPTMAGAWSVSAFAKTTQDGIQSVMNFSSPVGAHQGWALGRGAGPATQKQYEGEIGDGVTTQFLVSDTDNAAGTWFWLVLTRDSGGTVRFYINGVQQTTTYSGTYSSPGATVLSIGYPVGTGTTNPTIRVAYAAVWTTRALSTSEIAGIYSGL